MSTFGLICTIVSIAIFAVWLTICIKKFGLAPSYSAYSPKWDEVFPAKGIHLWSVVTFVVALLLMFPLLELGEGNPWQFLGFFAPLYLIVVAFFPLTADTAPKRYRIHCTAAVVCAVGALLWLALVLGLWWLPLITAFLAFCSAMHTRTLLTATVFWAEMAAFAAVYAGLIIP